MIDIDDFKQLNDTHGHQAGDDCLIVIGAVLKTLCKRPGDLLARYGGEEFAVILGNTTLQESLGIAQRMVQAVRDLRMPNQGSANNPTVTVSIGVAAMRSLRESTPAALIAQADNALYEAKKKGKNQIVHLTETPVEVS